MRSPENAQSEPEMRVPLMRPMIDEEMVEAAVQALQNERLVLGESVFKFEEEFARYVGVKYAVSTNSGTDALHIALLALGVGPGDEVITTPASFVASANCALHAGAKPVFADIDIRTYTLDPSEAEKAVTERTRAILPVHLYGHPADMGAIMDLAEEKGLLVVEDACQAHGAVYRGRKVGSIGHVGCFSFYPSKNMTVAGDGGMITTDDEDVAERAASLRNCGRSDWYVFERVGFTARLNTVNAAIGLVQLRRLDGWNEARRRIAGLYRRLLSGVEVVLPPAGDEQVRPVYHLFVIRTKHRDALADWLRSRGVECAVHYRLPIHLQPVYRRLFGFRGGEFPRAEELSRTCLSLPMWPGLTDDQVRYVCEAIEEFFDRKLWERWRPGSFGP